MTEKVAILDPGAQYGKVIDRKVREAKVESELLPMNTSAAELRDYKAVIIAGGPQSVYGEDAPSYDPGIFNLGVPMLGICYGMQLINKVDGGEVEKKDLRQDGERTIDVIADSELFHGLDATQTVLMSHGDSVERLADGYRSVATSDGLVAAIEHAEKRRYGVQVHPEVDNTEHGREILDNFLYRVCNFSGDFTMEDRIETAVSYIRETVGDNSVLCLVSGGVDSTVCAALLLKALGPEKMHALHIDNGLMRYKESANVETALKELGLDLQVVDASEEFYHATTEVDGRQTLPLNQVADPRDKRAIIGDTFMRVPAKVASGLGLDPEKVLLAQGTLRPDLIESGSKDVSKTADEIKRHHNDTDLPRKLRDEGRIVEPLKDYHKDEVRELGRMLGLPEEFVMRHPYPGPGLGVRIICAEQPYINEDFERINEQLQTYSTNGIHATLLPVQTVGVQGDKRSFSYLVGLSGERNWDELFRLAREIPDNIHQVNRLAYVYGEPVESPVTTITPTLMLPEVIYQLQFADDIVTQELLKYDLMKVVAQFPVVSFPVNFGEEGKRSIALRPFKTKDFMTGKAAVPGVDIPEDALSTMVSRILKEAPNIARVVYDLTSKPPATTEWE